MFTQNTINKAEDSIFRAELEKHAQDLQEAISAASFLVLGGAGSIGQFVVKELLSYSPARIVIVDLSENNLAELVRDIRSSQDASSVDLSFLPLDIASIEFNAFMAANTSFDYVLNLSALKHVRSEKDPYTLMRLLQVNVINTHNTLQTLKQHSVKKYFSVSTDKASSPINVMGASKRLMEYVMNMHSSDQAVSSARFANVAFSDGSLLHSFQKRIEKHQPLVVPGDVKRYFMTGAEAGQLCVLSCILGDNTDIFFPVLDDAQSLHSFPDIAATYMAEKGYQLHFCESEEEARASMAECLPKGLWPCLKTQSDTSGEKDIETFFSKTEQCDFTRFNNIASILNYPAYSQINVQTCIDALMDIHKKGHWNMAQLIEQVNIAVPEFSHQFCSKSLDEKM